MLRSCRSYHEICDRGQVFSCPQRTPGVLRLLCPPYCKHAAELSGSCSATAVAKSAGSHGVGGVLNASTRDAVENQVAPLSSCTACKQTFVEMLSRPKAMLNAVASASTAADQVLLAASVATGHHSPLHEAHNVLVAPLEPRLYEGSGVVLPSTERNQDFVAATCTQPHSAHSAGLCTQNFSGSSASFAYLAMPSDHWLWERGVCVIHHPSYSVHKGRRAENSRTASLAARTN